VAGLRNAFVAAAAALGVSACAGIQESPMAPNMVRLDVDSPAAPLTGQALMRRAAELTIFNGYSAFRLEPIYVQSFDQYGVTVVMFHADDSRAFGAYDAVHLLNGYPR
jgi:hypothetical protein